MNKENTFFGVTLKPPVRRNTDNTNQSSSPNNSSQSDPTTRQNAIAELEAKRAEDLKNMFAQEKEAQRIAAETDAQRIAAEKDAKRIAANEAEKYARFEQAGILPPRLRNNNYNPTPPDSNITPTSTSNPAPENPTSASNPPIKTLPLLEQLKNSDQRWSQSVINEVKNKFKKEIDYLNWRYNQMTSNTEKPRNDDVHILDLSKIDSDYTDQKTGGRYIVIPSPTIEKNKDGTVKVRYDYKGGKETYFVNFPPELIWLPKFGKSKLFYKPPSGGRKTKRRKTRGRKTKGRKTRKPKRRRTTRRRR